MKTRYSPKTIDLGTKLRGITIQSLVVNSPAPRAKIYCLRPNFNISKIGLLLPLLLNV